MSIFLTPLQGYDDFNVRPAASSVLEGSITNGGASSVCNYTCCTDIESVYSALNMSASIAASYGIGSGDAKTQFLSTLSQDSTSVHVVIYSNYAIGNYASVTGFEIDLPDPFDTLSFYQSYGDSYVSSTQSGIEFCVVYTFQSLTDSEQSQLMTSLNMAGIGEGGSVSIGFQSTIENFRSSTSILSTVQCMTQGYAGALPATDGLIPFALALATLYEPTQAATLSFETTSYSVVTGYPVSEESEMIDNNVNLFAILADSLAEISQCLDEVSEVQEIYGRYGYSGDATFYSNAALLNADTVSLNAAFDSLQEDPTQGVPTPALNYPNIGYPQLNYSCTYVPLGGGNGGQAWSDLNCSAVEEQWTLQQLVLRGGNVLNALNSQYVSPFGQPQNFAFGNFGNSGDNSTQLNLGANERIQSISTTWCKYVNSISFTTVTLPSFTACQTVSAPNNPDIPDPYNSSSWQMSPQGASTFQCFAGLAGNSGSDIDSISLLQITFMPAIWTPPTPNVSRVQPVHKLRAALNNRVGEAA